MVGDGERRYMDEWMSGVCNLGFLLFSGEREF